MADSQIHDCKDLASKLGWHDTRIKDLEEFKAQTTAKLQSIENLQERTFREMTTVATKTDSIAINQQTIQLDMAKETGRREQSSKNLYIFIALVGLLPKLVDIVSSIKSALP